MNIMADALVRAKIVSKEEAEKKLQQHQLELELNRKKRLKRRKRDLRKQIREIAAAASQGGNRFTLAAKLLNLQKRYSDVFDEVAIEEAYAQNLKALKE